MIRRCSKNTKVIANEATMYVYNVTSIKLTMESMSGRAVDVGFRVELLVVVMDSFVLSMLVADSNEAVCLLEFECFKIGCVDFPDGSFSTFCNRSGMSIVFNLFVVVDIGTCCC